MEPVVLRDEEPPDDAVVVIRGGLMAPDSVRRAAEVSMVFQGFHGLSVFAAEGLNVEELVSRTPELSPERYRQLRSSTVGRLRSSGFALIPTLEWPHCDIVLPDTADSTIKRLSDCFGPAFLNPAL